MGTKKLEGFDKYGPVGQAYPTVNSLLAQGGWGVRGGNAGIAAALNNTGGYALQLPTQSVNSGYCDLALGQSYGTVITGFRFSYAAANAGWCGVVFTDGTTQQCAVAVQGLSGLVSVISGTLSASPTILATSTVAVSPGTAPYIEVVMTFGTGSSGSWLVYLNGTLILSGTGTTQKTSNASCNVISLFGGYSGINSSGPFEFDDFYFFDTSTSHNTAPTLSNPIVYTQVPISDQQTQFSNNGNVVGNYYATGGTNVLIGANTLYLIPVIPSANCTLNSVHVLATNTNGSGKLEGVCYADSSGNPGALLSGGTVVVGYTAGNESVLPITTPQNLTAGTRYWIGFLCDSNFQVYSTGPIGGVSASRTFTLGPANPAGTVTGATGYVVYGSCSGASTDWESVAVNPTVGDLSSITTTGVGNTDLYHFSPLPSNLTAIFSVGVSINARLQVAGTDQVNCVVNSSGTISNGSNPTQTPNTTYIWLDSYNDTDPNTTGTWSQAAVTNSFAGPELAS